METDIFVPLSIPNAQFFSRKCIQSMHIKEVSFYTSNIHIYAGKKILLSFYKISIKFLVGVVAGHLMSGRIAKRLDEENSVQLWHNLQGRRLQCLFVIDSCKKSMTFRRWIFWHLTKVWAFFTLNGLAFSELPF